MSSSSAEDYIDISDFVFDDPQANSEEAIIESGPLGSGSGGLDDYPEFTGYEVDPNDDITGSSATWGVTSSLYP